MLHKGTIMDANQIKQIQDTHPDEEILRLQELLEIHKNNLHKLQKRAAKHGINVPLEIENGIEHEGNQIQLLELSISSHKILKQIYFDYNDSPESKLLLPQSIFTNVIMVNQKIVDMVQ